MNEKLINLTALYKLIEVEPFLLLGALILGAWLFYKFFLTEASEERHRNTRKKFQVLLRQYVVLAFMFLAFSFMQRSSQNIGSLAMAIPYLAFLTFIWGNIVFVNTCRLIVLLYLFLGSMKHGVPLLLVNIFSLILSIVLMFWGLSYLFNLEIGPLLATSAAASVILGLALQDTLGNLFAGISLQLDRNFEIGDWLEIVSGLQRATGQVKEITWRSVTLVGFSDEQITFPNRFIANAQISNFSPPDTPIVRSQIFRIQYGENIEHAKQVLERVAAGIGEIRGIPAPWAYVNNTTDSWIELKVIYFIDNFGSQFSIGDKMYVRSLESLTNEGIKLSRQVIEVTDKRLSHDS